MGSGQRRAALLLVWTACGAGTALRLAPVDGSFLFGDELHSLTDAERGLAHVLTRFDSTGSGMALPLLQHVLVSWLPASHWVIRAPAWIPGVLLVGLAYPLFRRRFGDAGAAIATALLAVSPLLVFYSHFGRAYALAVLASAVALWALESIVAGPRASGRTLGWLAASAAVAPWAHASTLAFVGPAAVGAVVALVAARDRRRDVARVVAVLVVAAVVCALLHAPAWRSLLAFASSQASRAYYGRFDALDVATLVVGGGALAAPALCVVGVAAAVWLRAMRWQALPLLGALLGPPVALALVRPYGDAYAYARYAVAAVVPAALVTGHALARVAGERRVAAIAAGALLAAGLFALGPYGLRRVDDGPYANTYLTMQPLPAFDVPFPDAPAFYRELAARPEAERAALRIVEVPPLSTRSRQYYRNLFLQHRVDTLLGVPPGAMRRVPDGPYADLGARDWVERADADYVVLHVDPTREVARYWRFVYGPAVRERTGDPSLVAFMERQQRFGTEAPTGLAAVAAELRERFGAPRWSGDGVAVWALR